jgi:hypothetical protein
VKVDRDVPCDACGYRQAYAFQMNSLNEDLRELKQRVQRLETTLARGVMLLVMNLAAVIVSLAQQLMNA